MRSLQYSPPETRPYFEVFAILVVALVARIAFMPAAPVLAPDSHDYLKLSDNLARGAFSLDSLPPYEPTIRRAPLYPAFLFLLSCCTGIPNHWTVVAAQVVLDTITCAIVYLLAKHVATREVAFTTAVVYALHPAAAHSCSQLLTETLFTFLLSIAAYVTVVSSQKHSVRLAFLSGGLYAGAILCRPLGVIFSLAALSYLLLNGREERSLVVAVLAGIVTFLTPWQLRMVSVVGGPTFVQGAGSVNFYVPSRFDWDQRDQAEVWSRFRVDSETQAFNEARTAVELSKADTALFKCAVERISAEPLRYAVSRAHSVPYLFLSSYGEVYSSDTFVGRLLRSNGPVQGVTRLLSLVSFSVLPMALALVALPKLRRCPELRLTTFGWVYFITGHSILWIEYRFWLPALPMLFASSAAGVELTRQFVHSLRRVHRTSGEH